MTADIRRIAFSGPIGASKTKLANLFVQRLGYVKLSFADEIRREVASIYNIPIEDLSNHNKEQYRHLLISHGEAGRLKDKGKWARPLIKKIRKNGYYSVVVDDLRFSHEAKILRNNNFILFRLEVPPERTYQYLTEVRGMDEEDALARMEDITENSFSSFDSDYTIPFYESDAKTYLKVCEILNTINATRDLLPE